MSGRDEERRYRALLGLPGGVGAIEDLLAGLEDDSWRVRKAAVDRLVAEVPASVLLPRLVAALGSEDSASLRNSAMEALVRLGEPAIGRLSELARVEGPELRKFAIDALGAIGSEAAAPVLERALADPDPNVRFAAIEALGKLPRAFAVGRLLDVLAVSPAGERLAALDALARAGVAVPFERLSELAQDRRLRRAVLRALAYCDDARAVELLLAGVDERVRSVREAAFASLGVHAGRGRLPSLPKDRGEAIFAGAVEALQCEDPAVAAGAAAVLGGLGRPDLVVLPLARAAIREEMQPALRRALVAQGTALVKPVEAVLPLLPAAGRALVFGALGDIASEGSRLPVIGGLALRWMLPASEEGERVAAIELLGRLGLPEAIGPVAALLGEPAPIGGCAERALAGIAKHAPEAVRPVCRARLREGGNRAPWLRLLGRVGTAEDLALLETEAQTTPAERCAALEALAALAPAGPVEALQRSLADSTASVRMAALRALAQRGDVPEASLGSALADEDDQVASLAAELLAPRPEAGPILAEAFRREQGRRPAVALALLRAALSRDGNGDGLLGEALEGEGEVLEEGLRAAARHRCWSLLHRHAEHGRWDVRCLVASALREEGGPAAMALLERMRARETNALAAEEEAAALAALRGREVG